MRGLHLRKTETWSTNQEAKQTGTASGKENPSLHAVSSSPSLQEETFPVPNCHNWSTPFAASVRSRNSLQSASQAPRTATASLRHARESLSRAIQPLLQGWHLFFRFEQSPRVTRGTRPAADLINAAAETNLVIEQKLARRNPSRAQSNRTLRKTASDR